MTSERDEDIRARRQQGETLAEIGARYGLTKERVRQILKRTGGVDSRAAVDARAIRTREAAHAKRESLLTAWREGLSYRTIGQRTGLAAASVKEVIASESTPADLAARRRSQMVGSGSTVVRWSDAELVEGIRSAARRLGRTPSSDEYDVLSRELGVASVGTITNRLGWSNAVRAAGFEPVTARRSYTRRWTEEACLDALRRVVAELGRFPTLSEYQRICSEGEDLPSSATLRHRIGSWTEIGVLITSS